MNTPAPVPASGSVNAAPTIGALIGGAAGVVVASKLGVNPADPTGIAVVSTVSGLLTMLFHWLGIKTGLPGLG
jgi:hypothetical protein